VSDLPLKNATWTITDGRVGMQNQCLGLAEAVGLPVESKIVSPLLPWSLLPVTSWPAPFLSLGPGSSAFTPPWPRLVIGCGWRSIPFVIEVKRRSGGRTMTVQLQDPRVPAGLFDLVVPPEHDELTGPNVLPIVGSPNMVTPERLAAAAAKWQQAFRPYPSPRVAVLIGGKSKSCRFDKADAEALADQLRALLHEGYALMVTTSRRTGEEQTRILAEALNAKHAYLWSGSGENPYMGMLALADAILVTSDSTNMMVEAASTGKPVHVLRLHRKPTRLDSLVDRLEALGAARRFTGRIETWVYQPLAETARVAERIRGKLAPRG
jgi:mitochondrial fission protein ELM1